MNVKVKICGLKTPEAVEAAQDEGASFLGFVFCEKSPRHITYDIAKELGKLARIPKVAVTVDATDDELTQIMASLNPEYIQLHGNETDERAEVIKNKFGVKLIKAFSAHSSLLTAHLASNKQQAVSIYDFILLDSPGGGTGQQFDYTNFKAPTALPSLPEGENLLNTPSLREGVGGGLHQSTNTPPPTPPSGGREVRWFLSGGLNAANVESAIAQTGAKYVDVSSGVESSKGVKDVQLIKQFISKVHANHSL